MNIIVFDSESAALAAVRKIYVEKVRDALADGKSIRNGGDFVTDLTGWMDDEIVELKICGHQAGEVVFNHGLTEDYAQVQKSPISEQWFFPLCDDKYLEFISDHTIMELPEDWRES